MAINIIHNPYSTKEKMGIGRRVASLFDKRTIPSFKPGTDIPIEDTVAPVIADNGMFKSVTGESKPVDLTPIVETVTDKYNLTHKDGGDFKYAYNNNQWWAKDATGKEYDLKGSTNAIANLTKWFGADGTGAKTTTNTSTTTPTTPVVDNTTPAPETKVLPKLDDKYLLDPEQQTTVKSIFEGVNTSMAESEKFNKYSSILDAAITGGDMVANMLAKPPKPNAPPKTYAAVYDNPYTMDMAILNQSAGEGLAMAQRTSEQAGIPEYQTANFASYLDAMGKGAISTSADVMKYRNMQKEADATARTANSLSDYTTGIANRKAVFDDNVMRAELMGKDKTDLAKIGKNYFSNRSAIKDSLWKNAYQYNILTGNNIDADTASLLLGYGIH